MLFTRTLALLITSSHRSFSIPPRALNAVYRTLLELGPSEPFHITEQQAMAVKMATLGYSVFIHLPTGAGKSLAFQAPALLSSSNQTTLVVSPLIALMNDQVEALKRKGIDAIQVAGGNKHQSGALDQLLVGQKFVYTTPEFLLLNAEMKHWVCVAAREARLARIVLDEAHCVYEWGNTFRPSYLELCHWKKQLLSDVPLTFVTASVSDEDIARLAEMFQLQVVSPIPVKINTLAQLASRYRQLVVIQHLTDRTNLRIEVVPKMPQAVQWIAHRVKTATTIVYCMTRKEAEDICRALVQIGCQAGVYHGGIPQRRREFVRKQWMLGTLTIICATSAFGMGIDRSDVRFVIHHSLPLTISAYWQQIGRSGRDGKPSVCVLLYSRADKNRASLLTTDLPKLSSSDFRDYSIGSLRSEVEEVASVCEMQIGCRKELLFSHFGFAFDASRCTRNCNCDLPFDREFGNDERYKEVSIKRSKGGDGYGISSASVEYQYQKILAESKRLKLPKRDALSRRLIRDILEARPKSEEEMASMRAIGPVKASRYYSLFCFD